MERIFLVGYMGSGKTTIGRYVAQDMGWRFVDMDCYVEQMMGCSVGECFARRGEGAFRRAEAEALRLLAGERRVIVATGGGSPCHFDNMEVMRRSGLTVYIKVEPRVLAMRLRGAKAGRPLIAQKSDDELEAFVEEQLSLREPFYARAEMTVDGERLPFSAYKPFFEAFNSNINTTMARKAALFDLDGVVLDTERQYDIIWGRIGRAYHPDKPDFARQIKGMTLESILSTFFADADVRRAVSGELYRFEAEEMRYDFVPGALAYILSLRTAGVQTAVVTSSNNAKMDDVRRHVGGFDDLFDVIVTSELTPRSKPAPDAFLRAAEMLGRAADECVVFEDSRNGMAAGRAAGMLTVGVATTFGRDVAAELADVVIDDFQGIAPERFFNIEP